MFDRTRQGVGELLRPWPVAGDFDLAGRRVADDGAVIVERDQIAVRVRSRNGHLLERLESAPRVRQAGRVGRHDVSDHDPTPVAERERTSGIGERKSHSDTLAREPPNAIRSNGGRASWETTDPRAAQQRRPHSGSSLQRRRCR
jgi:hypothetical protein